MKFSDLINSTKDVEALFDALVPKKWGVEAMVTELIGEVGSLADQIMIERGYRLNRSSNRDQLEDEVSDVLFMLIRIALFYGINLEKAYETMIAKTKSDLSKRLAEKGRQ